jgi:cytochrome c oxidase cbb3-type subunit III
MKKKNTFLKIFIFIASMFMGPVAFATSVSNTLLSENGFAFWFTVGMIIFILSVIVFILQVLLVIAKYSDKVEPGVADISLWEKIKKSLTREVSVENEEEIMFHHEYDGIRELDNSLPPWWVYMFYISIISGVIYFIHYHVTQTGDLQAAEYQTEIREAETQIAAFMKSQANSIDENNVALLTDKNRIKNGEDLFIKNCIACHGKAGEGATVGPNLTDEYWLHGGGIKNVFKTIKYGVTDKGMISWKQDLSPSQIQDVASFIISIKGSNPANAKAPQGELYKE